MTETVFPAFIRAQYEPGRAWAEFKTEANRELGDVKRKARTTFEEIRGVAESIMTKPMNAAGNIDLGVGRIREAAAASEARAASLRDVIAASERLAARETAMTGALQAEIAATRAALAAEEQKGAALRGQAVLYEAIQTEINATTQAQNRYTASTLNSLTAGARTTASVGQQRAGMQQLSFQIGDVSQQLALGVNPAIVFGQQMGQVTQAVQLMTNKTTGFIGFLAGPWGAVLTGAATAIALVTSKMFENADAAKTAETGADALAQAQSALGSMFDLTSGKLVRQNELLALNARLTAINLRADAQSRRASAEATFRDAGEVSPLAQVSQIFSRQAPGSSPSQRLEMAEQGPARLREYVDAIRSARTEAERTAALDRALRETERMPIDRLTGITAQQWRQAIIDTATARQNDSAAAMIDESLNTGSVVEGLRRTGTGGGRTRDGAGAVARLAEFGEDAGRRIDDLAARFTDAPTAVEAVTRAMAQLDDIASDIERRRSPNFEELLGNLSKAREAVQTGLVAPYQEWIDEQDRQLELQRLINSGREEEAQLLDVTYRIGKAVGELGEEEREQIRRRIELRAEEARQAETERQRQQAYLQVIDQTRSGLEDAIANLNTRGLAGLGDVAQGLYGGFRQLTASSLVESLFGDTFQQLEDYVSGRGRLRAANDELADNAQGAASGLDEFKDALRGATDALRGGGSGSGGAPAKALGEAMKSVGDTVKQATEDAAIVITGRRPQSDLYDLNPRRFIARTVAGLLGPLAGSDEGAQRLSREIGEHVATAMQGAFLGQSASSILFGRSGSSTGSALGGALGNILGEELGPALGKAIGGTLGQTLGSAAGPIGSVVGGIAGSLLGGLLSSTPRASSTIGGNGSQLAVAATTGTRRLQGQTVTAADSVIGSVQRIAEMFGATVNASRGSVSIGIRDGNLRVDPTGRGVTKTKRGAIDFGEDADAAIRAAVLDLIQDGVIEGLKAGTRRLLQSGKDLDAAVQKALDFESVFRSLKERIDPIGAAMDALDDRFSRLRRIFQEAGASAADYAQLEQLYGHERADAIEEASERMTGALRGLIDSLTVDNDALSLRERLSIAKSKYDPLAARVAAGDQSVDYDEFAEQGRLVEQLTRQIYGSTQPYFEMLEQVTSLAQGALNQQQALIDQATGGGAANDNTSPVVSAVDRLGDTLTENLLGGLTPYLAQLVRQGGAGAGRVDGGRGAYANIRNF